MNGENVVSALQPVNVLADVEANPSHRRCIVVPTVGAGVPGGVECGVGVGDAGAVEVRDEAVIILHPEHHEVGFFFVRCRHVERDAHEHRLVDVVHLGVHVDADVRVVISVLVVADTVVTTVPVVMVKRLTAAVPSFPKVIATIVHGRNHCPFFCIAL